LCVNDDDCPNDLRCVTARHVCAGEAEVVDTEAPALVATTISPEFATTGTVVELSFEANEPLAQDEALALHFTGATDPGFALVERPSPSTARFELAVSDSHDEGTFRLTAVTLTDADRNAAVRDVANVAVVIDRTPPTLRNLNASAGSSAAEPRLSDVDGSNELEVDFDLSEPVLLEDIRVVVGELSTEGGEVSCAERETALGYRCATRLTAGDVEDGRNEVAVTARDPAGNVAEATTEIIVDAAAPVVEPGSAQVEIRSPTGLVTDALIPGGTAQVSFVVSEDLDVDPVLTLQAGATQPGSLVAAAGRFYAFVLTLDTAGLPAGNYPVSVALEDRFGHAATSQVALPPPHEGGLLVRDTLLSQCVIPTDGGAECPDFDGDGVRGPALGCSTVGADDCDDTDPTTYPGAVEIPGDSLDNDCAGDGDAPIDESTGVFVAPLATGSGTRADPIGTVQAGVAAAESAGKRWVFVAAGIYGSQSLTSSVNIMGGLDAATWEPGGVSQWEPGALVLGGAEPVVLADLFLSPCALISVDTPSLLTNVTVNCIVDLHAHAIIVGSDLRTRLVLSQDAAYSRVVGSTVGELGGANGLVTAVRTRFQTVVDVYDSTATFIDSSMPGLHLQAGGTAALFHSVVLAAPGSTAIRLQGDNAHVTLVNTAVEAEAGLALSTELASHGYKLHGVLFDVVGGELVPGIAADSAGLTQLAGCSAVECDSAGDLVLGDITAESPFPVLPAGVGLGVDPFEYGAPPATVRDRDGQCRLEVGNPPDIGVDEV
jgi:hypothetical protein